MKDFIAMFMLIGMYLLIIKENYLFGFILLGILCIPFLLIWLFEMKISCVNRQKSIIDFKKIWHICSNIALITEITVYLCLSIFYGSKIELEQVIYLSFYFIVVICEWLLINYFATTSVSLRKTIMAFIQAIDSFFKQNFLISIVVLIFSISLQFISKELLMGAIGSYLFFLLTEVNNYYKSEKEDSRKYNKYDIAMQFLVNIAFIFVLSDFELIYHLFIDSRKNESIQWIQTFIHILIFILLVGINRFMPVILNNKIFIFIKGKWKEKIK